MSVVQIYMMQDKRIGQEQLVNHVRKLVRDEMLIATIKAYNN